MAHEYEVLTHLSENEITTQRQISRGTGLSLGTVNLLLKKMVRKGLVKIERLNARTMRYILTPQGMEEKARLAYRYIRKSYRQIMRINQALDRLLAERTEEGDGKVILCGPADEIREILTLHLKSKNVPFEHCPESALLQQKTAEPAGTILIWREEEEEMLSGCQNTVNILSMV